MPSLDSAPFYGPSIPVGVDGTQLETHITDNPCLLMGFSFGNISGSTQNVTVKNGHQVTGTNEDIIAFLPLQTLTSVTISFPGIGILLNRGAHVSVNQLSVIFGCVYVTPLSNNDYQQLVRLTSLFTALGGP